MNGSLIVWINVCTERDEKKTVRERLRERVRGREERSDMVN